MNIRVVNVYEEENCFVLECKLMNDETGTEENASVYIENWRSPNSNNRGRWTHLHPTNPNALEIIDENIKEQVMKSLLVWRDKFLDQVKYILADTAEYLSKEDIGIVEDTAQLVYNDVAQSINSAMQNQIMNAISPLNSLGTNNTP